MCLCVKEVQELLEAKEQECVRLRRELKELKNTVSLRQLLTQGKICSDWLQNNLKFEILKFNFGLPCAFRIKYLCPYLNHVFSFLVLPSAFSPETTPCPSRRKPATVTGLFECRKRDENKLIKNLITGEIDPCLTYSSLSAIVKIKKGPFNKLCKCELHEGNLNQVHSRNLEDKNCKYLCRAWLIDRVAHTIGRCWPVTDILISLP